VRKELPADLSYEALAKPKVDYPYFAGADEFPFEPENTAFSAVNAWWMAELSLLAYVPDQAFVRERLARAGLLEVFFLERESTHGFLAANADATIVAFRGTDDLTDVLLDLRALLTPEGDRAAGQARLLVHRPQPRRRAGDGGGHAPPSPRSRPLHLRLPTGR